MKPLILHRSSEFQHVFHKGDIIVNTSFHGHIICEGTFIVAQEACVSGEVHTRRAHIHGTFNGSLEASEHIIFSSGALFQGTLDARAMLCPLDTTLIGEIRIEPSKLRERV